MDVERRARERAARADPHDPASARALAEALRRSGDRRALFHALCALARAGDAEAAAEVEAWHPWPGPDGRGNRRAGPSGATVRPVRDPVRTRVARLPVGVPRAIAGASSTHLFVVCVPSGWTPQGTVPGEVLVAVELATLEVAWRVESETARADWRHPAVLVGEEVAWGTGDAVRVVSTRDGAERLRLPLGLGGNADGHVLLADRDRLASRALDDLDRALLLFEVPSGALLWERRGVDADDPVAASDDELLLCDGQRLAFEDGRPCHPRTIPSEYAVQVARLGPGDHVALLLQPPGSRTLARVRPWADAHWTVHVAGESARDQLTVVDDVVVADATSTDGLDWSEVRALDTGNLLWSRARRRDDGPLPARSTAGAGGDVLFLDAGARSSTLLGFDLAHRPTLVLTLELPLLVRPPFRDIARVDFAELVALDGALLIVATGDEGDLVIACVDGPAVASVENA